MRPLVSVITLAFNHEKFIGQCLAGVTAQTGDFDLEHWVVDDASTDRTAQILREYANSRSGVTVLTHHENRGANAGMMEAYAQCRGDYVALCEGDDFWTAPDKLQTQVALMERRQDLGLCYHDAVLFYEERQNWPVVRPAFGPSVQSLDDLLTDNRAHTCTVMYRRIPGLEFPDWYVDFTVGDWPNHAFHAARGGIGYINRAIAAYRIHAQGSWSVRKEHERAHELAAMLEKLDSHFLFRHSDRLTETSRRILAEAGLHAA